MGTGYVAAHSRTPRPHPVPTTRRSKTNGHAALENELTPADLKGLGKFRIPPELVLEAGVLRLTGTQAASWGFGLDNKFADLAGIAFPYLDDDGEQVNARLRRDNPTHDINGKPEQKYLLLPREKGRRLLYRPPGATKSLKDPKTPVLLVEAEKSALAITAAARRDKRNLAVLAMGGCLGWRERVAVEPNAKEKTVKPEATIGKPMVDLAILKGRKVGVMLDANVAENAQVQNAELKLCAYLAAELGAEVVCYRVPAEPGVNGPDDYLAKHKDAELWKLLDAPVEPWLSSVGETYEAYMSAAPPEFLIKDFLQTDGITMIAGLSGHGKTWLLLSMLQALLTGTPLFGDRDFGVVKQASRVLYLSPEITLGSLKKRGEKFGLGEYIQNGKLVVRTLTAYPMLPLTDPALLLCARGADVFLDTAVRFIEGDENSSSENNRGLADAVFRLLSSGARSVTAAHHSPKGFQKESYMSLENMLRGTGDIGAMAATAWGVRMLDPKQTLLHIENLKPRDFNPPPPFQVIGRPSIDEGKGLQMHLRPGECGHLADYVEPRKGGRPKSPEKEGRMALLVQWVKQEKTQEECAALLVEKEIQIAPGTLNKEFSAAKRQAKFS